MLDLIKGDDITWLPEKIREKIVPEVGEIFYDVRYETRLHPKFIVTSRDIENCTFTVRVDTTLLMGDENDRIIQEIQAEIAEEDDRESKHSKNPA